MLLLQIMQDFCKHNITKDHLWVWSATSFLPSTLSRSLTIVPGIAISTVAEKLLQEIDLTETTRHLS